MIKVLSNSLVMINLNVLKGLSIALKEVDGLDGSGNPFGSSLPFPAGFNMASFPVSTSNSKSILPVNSNSFPILGVSFSFLNPKTKQTFLLSVSNFIFEKKNNVVPERPPSSRFSYFK